MDRIKSLVGPADLESNKCQVKAWLMALFIGKKMFQGKLRAEMARKRVREMIERRKTQKTLVLLF